MASATFQSDLFLLEEDVNTLTGIRQGKRCGSSTLTKYQRQAEHLKRQRIPFHVDARGRPIVARAAIEGGRMSVPEPPPKWQPRVIAG